MKLYKAKIGSRKEQKIIMTVVVFCFIGWASSVALFIYAGFGPLGCYR